MALEEILRLRLASRDDDLRGRLGSGGGGVGSSGGGGDDVDEGEGARPTMLLSSPQREGSAIKSGSLLGSAIATLQMGTVTRRNVPMAIGCPEGFGPPNLAAFLWESQEEAYGSGSGDDSGFNVDEDADPPLAAPHSEIEGCGRWWPSDERRSTHGMDDDDHDGTVFEVSATAVVSSAFRHHDERENLPSTLNETIDALPRQRWVPAAVAPEETMERALQCSTLIVNSPSFGSACARRFFSRIGRPPPRPVSPQPALPPPLPPLLGQTTNKDRSRPTLPIASLETTASNNGSRQVLPEAAPAKEEAGGGGAASSCNADEEETGQCQSSRRRLQGNTLRHVMVLGESPIGDGGLAELSSAVRFGWLPQLTTLVIGGPGCRVGPRGVMALAMALSSPGCSRLRNLVSTDGGRDWSDVFSTFGAESCLFWYCCRKLLRRVCS